MQKQLHSLLLLLLLFVLGIQIYLLGSRILGPQEAWVPLILASAGVVALLQGGDRAVAMVLGSFLVSFSIAMSGLSWGEFRILLPGLLGRAVDFLWTGLLCGMPFLFLHLALLFPVKNTLMARWPRLVLVLYAAPLLLAIAGQFDELIWLVDPFVLLFPLGLLSGIGIFVGQYFFHLTRAEKNRLRLVLIGCVAGVIPRLLFLLAREQLPVAANQFSLILLPLFPLGLLMASQQQSVQEIRPAFQRLFSWAVTGSVWVAVSFLLFVLAVLILPGLSPTLRLLGSAGVGLILVGPIGRAAISYLTERDLSSERRQTHSLEFSPISPNPFVVGNPVRESRMFFGRKSEFHFISDTLGGGAQGSIIVLCGERRTGKTSILCQIQAGRLGPGYRSVFLDMQGIIADHDLEFLALLRQECERSLRAVGSPLAEVTTGSSPYTEFTEFLRATSRSLGADRLLLLVDEYELIDERIQAGRLSPEIPRFLNSLLQHIPGLSLILTGSSGLEGRPLWNDLLGKSFFREVSFLGKADVEALIREPLIGKVSLQGDALARLLRLSAGHPYFTQLLGQNLVDWLNENQETLITPERIERVVARILEHPPPHLVYMWEDQPVDRRLVLASLASLISTPVEFVNWRRVSRVLGSIPDDRTRRIDETRTRILLEDLRQRGLVDRDQQRYRFKMDLIRVWVAAEHSVWSVLSDL